MASNTETNTAAQPGIHPATDTTHPTATDAAEQPVDVHSPVAEHAVELATARKDILRIATAGSVDDGKSTLIGRLLYDSKAIFEDQYEAVARASKGDHVDLALLTDGLRAEREQGITIDVAYRYFSTPRRTFILADTPGHVQYTRNMVTGASTADLAIVLVDARKGMLEQSRRHAFLASLLRVPHLVVAVNKMDLVDYKEEVFESIKEELAPFLARLEVLDALLLARGLDRGELVVEDRLRLVEQPPDQGRLAVVDRSAGEETQLASAVRAAGHQK